jgi:hypothetical protein
MVSAIRPFRDDIGDAESAQYTATGSAPGPSPGSVDGLKFQRRLLSLSETDDQAHECNGQSLSHDSLTEAIPDAALWKMWGVYENSGRGRFRSRGPKEHRRLRPQGQFRIQPFTKALRSEAIRIALIGSICGCLLEGKTDQSTALSSSDMLMVAIMATRRPRQQGCKRVRRWPLWS